MARPLEQLNLTIRFDRDLRDVPVCPEDMTHAVNLLRVSAQNESPSDKVKRLGQLGSFLRILGQLDEAEQTFASAVAIAAADPQLRAQWMANRLRLGHVYHWKKDFKQAHAMFRECIAQMKADRSLSTYLDFAHQHQGKCFFDEGNYEAALTCFFDAIVLRNNKSDVDLADSTLLAVNETKRRFLPQVPEQDIHHLLSTAGLPDFVKRKIGQELKPGDPRTNCINAALGFHGRERPSAYSPMELLKFLMAETEQIATAEDYAFGDLVVWWSRREGKWSGKKIVIGDMDIEDPEFPYDLIFDHVAVRVKPGLVFNKANPSPASPYQFDYLETASYPARLTPGFAMTFHRLKQPAATSTT